MRLIWTIFAGLTFFRVPLARYFLQRLCRPLQRQSPQTAQEYDARQKSLGVFAQPLCVSLPKNNLPLPFHQKKVADRTGMFFAIGMVGRDVIAGD
jgi:hypothetical protein